MKLKRLLRKGSILFLIMMVLSGVGAYRVDAEDVTVKTAGSVVPTSEVEELNVRVDEVDTEIPQYSGAYQSMGVGDGITMEKGIGYIAEYPMDYFGKELTVKVTVTLTDDSNADYPANPSKFVKLYLNANKYVTVACFNIDHAKVKWDISVYDKKDNSSYLKYLLFGFMDPDESNYIFNTAGRSLYYSPENSNAANYYYVRDNGLYLSGGVADFNEEKFYIGMLDEETFTFTTETILEGGIKVPYFYARKYKISYVLNDSEESPATNPEKNPNQYAPSSDVIEIVEPSRTGYTFLGWKERLETGTEVDNSTIPAFATGDKTFVAYWEKNNYIVKYDPNWPKESPDEDRNHAVMEDDKCEYDTTYNLQENQFAVVGYKFLGWNTESDKTGTDYADKEEYKNLIAEDGGIVTMYAQWEPIGYIVKYDANPPKDETATGSMEDDKCKYNVDYNLTDNAFAVEGYEFVGWNTVADNTGTPYENQQGYRNLVNEDGGTVTMYAQWKKIEYKILYDGNGANNTMDGQIFGTKDTPMNSKSNEFVRDGYKFKYFVYYDDANVLRICSSVNDFEKLLKKMPDRTVTLIAQWEEIVYPQEQVRYAPPVTGVE